MVITVNPKLRLNPHGRVDPYLVGGVGYYRRTVQFTKPAVVSVFFFFDPFFGVFFNTLVPANQVLGTITEGGVGGSVGGGLDFKIKDTGFKVFGEVRYQNADTGRVSTTMVP